MMLRIIVLCMLVQVATCSSRQRKQLPSTTLSTGQQFPLVGLEVDGLRGDAVGQRIADAMQNSTQFALFDTAQRANNEKRLNMGIVYAVKSSDLHSSEVHVITKVPYTHLGYERTKLAVRESLRTLKNRNTHVHVLLEWPRCNDEIPWMHCEQDEARLPQHIKAAGPPPHLNHDAFLDSWRALEEIYLREVSLGTGLPAVANFEIEDLQALEEQSRVLPHIVQVRLFEAVNFVSISNSNLELT
jgi:diketogulonate reductase-like aldo/keto reductase